ncbi:hypothetical protein V8E51_019145 [Hyaloscypha variabilis]
MASSSSDKQYYLITNVRTTSSSQQDQREIDLHAQSWKLPYTIDDKDLMFDGKPLNMLYEENREDEVARRSEECVACERGTIGRFVGLSTVLGMKTFRGRGRGRGQETRTRPSHAWITTASHSNNKMSDIPLPSHPMGTELPATINSQREEIAQLPRTKPKEGN